MLASPVRAQNYSLTASVPATATVGAPGFSITVNLFNNGTPFNCSPSCPTVTITQSGGGGTLSITSAMLTGATTVIAGEQYTKAEQISLQLNTTISGDPVNALTNAITLTAGTYSQLLLLLPGESYSFASATGKTGTVTPQIINSAFTVYVRAMDQYFNLVSTTGANATLTTSPPSGVLTGTTSRTFNNGIASFSVAISTYWYNLSMTASDNVTGGITTQTDQITSYGSGYYFNVIAPGTITAGTPFSATMELRDSANGNILVNPGAIPSPAPTMTFSFTGTGGFGVASTPFNQNPLTIANQSYTQANASGISMSVSADIVPGQPRTGSTTFVVNPGPYSQTLLLLPGETPTTPGGFPVPVTGKTGTPPAYIIENPHQAVSITVKATDAYWNLVSTTSAAKLDTNPSGFIVGTNTASYSNGVANFNIQVSTVGATIGIVSSDANSGSITHQQDTLAVFPEPPIYSVVAPSIATMTPAAFPLQVALIGSISGSTITFANNGFALTPNPVTPAAAGSFTLGTTSGNLVGGVATIMETVSRTGTLNITATDTNPSFGFTGTSNNINVYPENHRYITSLPTQGIFGTAFPLTITRIDNATGLPVNRNRNIQVIAFYGPAYGSGAIAPATITITPVNTPPPVNDVFNAGNDNSVDTYQVTFHDNQSPAQLLDTHKQIYFQIYPQFDGDNIPGSLTTPLATLSTATVVMDISTGPAAGLALNVTTPFVVGSSTAAVTAVLTDGPEGHRIPGAAIDFALTQGVGTLSSTFTVTDATGSALVKIFAPSAILQGQVYQLNATFGTLSSTATVTLALPPLTQLTTSGPALTTPDNVLHVNTNTNITLTGITVAGVTISSVTCTLDSSLPCGSSIVTLSSSTTFNLPSGYHTIQFFSTDSLGQTGPTSTQTIQVAGGPLPSSGQLINYPNPFRAGAQSTILEYTLGTASDIRLRIFTILGKLVLDRTISQGNTGTNAGLNQITWDGRNGSGTVVANGGYVAILEISATGQKMTRKIAVVK